MFYWLGRHCFHQVGLGDLKGLEIKSTFREWPFGDCDEQAEGADNPKRIKEMFRGMEGGWQYGHTSSGHACICWPAS